MNVRERAQQIRSDQAVFGSAPTISEPTIQLRWMTERFQRLDVEQRRAVICAIAAFDSGTQRDEEGRNG